MNTYKVPSLTEEFGSRIVIRTWGFITAGTVVGALLFTVLKPLLGAWALLTVPPAMLVGVALAYIKVPVRAIARAKTGSDLIKGLITGSLSPAGMVQDNMPLSTYLWLLTIYKLRPHRFPYSHNQELSPTPVKRRVV